MSGFDANLWKIYLLKFLRGLHFFAGVLVPFFTVWGQVSFAEMMFLQSWFTFWVFALEVPTGAIADLFGRKLSIALGMFVTIFAVGIYGSVPVFWVFLLAEFLFALAAALLSGAVEALVYDTLKELGKEAESKKVFARLTTSSLFALMLAAPIGSFIAPILGLNAPMYLFTIPVALSFLVALTLKEPKVDAKDYSKDQFKIFYDGLYCLRDHRALRVIAIDFIVVSALAYFTLWLYQPLLLKSGYVIALFGLVHAAVVLGQMAFMNNFGFFERVFGSKRNLLTVSTLVLGVGFLVGALTSDKIVMLLAIVMATAFGLGRKPLLASYMNKHIPSAQRATINSSIQMFASLLLAVVNPLFGMAVDWSLDGTLLVLGFVTIAFALLWRVKEAHLVD